MSIIINPIGVIKLTIEVSYPEEEYQIRKQFHEYYKCVGDNCCLDKYKERYQNDKQS